MTKLTRLFSLCCLIAVNLFCSINASADDQTFHHRMEVILSPDNSEIQVKDQIQVPKNNLNQTTATRLEFSLHAGLSVTANEGGDIIALTVNEADIHAGPVPLKRYTVTLPAGQNTFTLTFSGRIHHAVQDPSLEYSRSFSYSPGLISAEGVFLANSTAW